MHPEQGRQGIPVLPFSTLWVLLSVDTRVLLTHFFCNKPPAVFRDLCTSAQQVFFRYSSSFIKIIWKIADLINEKVFFFPTVLLPQFTVFSKKAVQNKPAMLILLISSRKSCTLSWRFIFQRCRSHKVNALGAEGPQCINNNIQGASWGEARGKWSLCSLLLVCCQK